MTNVRLAIKQPSESRRSSSVAADNVDAASPRFDPSERRHLGTLGQESWIRKPTSDAPERNGRLNGATIAGLCGEGATITQEGQSVSQRKRRGDGSLTIPPPRSVNYRPRRRDSLSVEAHIGCAELITDIHSWENVAAPVRRRQDGNHPWRTSSRLRLASHQHERRGASFANSTSFVKQTNQSGPRIV